jgi:decaprenyl-phosphate phosphoribosyltransferase
MNTLSAVQHDRKITIREHVRAHLAIARFDHVTKNVFILPGIVIPLSVDSRLASTALIYPIVRGLIAASLIACSNYVINEVLDAPFDRFHPIKRFRPVPAGLVNIPLAYVQWLVMMTAGMAIGWSISTPFVLALGALWIMGCVYNFPPVRSKDVPYIDVLSESVNNPIRMLLGWYIVAPALVPPVSLLLSYWMAGCYFMALKRFSEFRDINGVGGAAAYRRSFASYTEQSLMVSAMLYAASAMLFFGAFLIRYRIELILAFPLVAGVMAVYLQLSYERESAVQNPEKLHRSPALMTAVVACVAVMLLLLWVDVPVLQEIFKPTLPLRSGR